MEKNLFLWCRVEIPWVKTLELDASFEALESGDSLQAGNELETAS